VNFQNIVNTAATAVTNALDFSRWEQESAPRDEITDLNLSGDDTVALLQNQYGLSDKLRSSFPFLTAKGGGLKALLKASYSFEHAGRDVSYEQLGALVGCNCNSAYQHGLRLRDAYHNAFGLSLVSTRDGLHLATVDEAKVQNDRVLANFEKHILPTLQKFGTQLRSLQQSNQQYALTARTQALLNAALTDDDNG
jgi:hypothetical protein